MDKNLLLTKAQNAELSRDFQTATRLYKELLRNEPDNLEYLSTLGSIYVKSNEDEKALPYYQRIIELFPHSVSAMNGIGAIYRRLKRYDESIEILQRALNENKDVANVYKQEFEQMYNGKFHNEKSAVINNENIKMDNINVSIYFSPINKTTTEKIIPIIKNVV